MVNLYIYVDMYVCIYIYSVCTVDLDVHMIWDPGRGVVERRQHGLLDLERHRLLDFLVEVPYGFRKIISTVVTSCNVDFC